MTQDTQIQELIKTIKESFGYDFSNYVQNSFKRRVDRLLSTRKISFEELLVQVKKANTSEVERFIADITVNTTQIFRNPPVWHAVKYRVLPKLKNKEKIDIWHAGCSTGQEVYSMLMMLNEINLLDRVNIYASDIDNVALQKARKGEYVYEFNIDCLENFDQVIRRNPFNYEEYNNVLFSEYMQIEPENNKISIKDFLIEKATFKQQDLVKKNNIFNKKFDIIMCRNVLIYFNRKLKEDTLDFFYNNLNFNGFLILGYHERFAAQEIKKFDKKHYYYKKRII